MAVTGLNGSGNITAELSNGDHPQTYAIKILSFGKKEVL